MLEAAMALKISPQWNPQRIRKEMAEGINSYLERELQGWSDQTGKEIEERLNQLTQDIGPDAATIDHKCLPYGQSVRVSSFAKRRQQGRHLPRHSRDGKSVAPRRL